VKTDIYTFDSDGAVKDYSEWALRDGFWVEML